MILEQSRDLRMYQTLSKKKNNDGEDTLSHGTKSGQVSRKTYRT